MNILKFVWLLFKLIAYKTRDSHITTCQASRKKKNFIKGMVTFALAWL